MAFARSTKAASPTEDITDPQDEVWEHPKRNIDRHKWSKKLEFPQPFMPDSKFLMLALAPDMTSRSS